VSRVSGYDRRQAAGLGRFSAVLPLSVLCRRGRASRLRTVKKAGRSALCAAVLVAGCRQPAPPSAPKEWEKHLGLDPHPAGQTLDGPAPTALPRASFRLDPQRRLAALSSDERPESEEEKLYREAAAQGQTWAQVRLGSIYVQQSEDPIRLAEGLRLLNAAAEKDDTEALRLVSNMTSEGRGVQQSDREAYVLMRRAAELGSPEAQLALAEMLATGRGMPRDMESAILWGRKAAEQGHVPAQFTMGRTLISSSEPERKKEAIEFLEKAAGDRGDAKAALFYSAVLLSGRFDVPKNEILAESMLRRWAEKGDPDCQLALAALYQTNENFAYRRHESPAWLQRAADGGNAKAIEMLRTAASRNVTPGADGVASQEAPQEPTVSGAEEVLVPSQTEQTWEPFELTDEERQYVAAANEGKPWAQTRLGVLYARDKNDPQRLRRAVQLLRAASQANEAEAQYQLALMHAEGRGVAKDPSEAINWHRKAATNGYTPAKYAVAVTLLESRREDEIDVEAIGWLESEAKDGHREATFLLAGATAYGHFGLSKNERKAAEMALPRAESGDPEFQFAVATLYLKGESFTDKRSEGVAWLKKAADAGHPQARELLAEIENPDQ